MINPSDFISLELQDQIKMIYTHGTFVVAIRYYGHKVNLYLMSNYYVEVFYNHKLDKIDKIDLLDTTHTRLKFYTDQISLPTDLS